MLSCANFVVCTAAAAMLVILLLVFFFCVLLVVPVFCFSHFSPFRRCTSRVVLIVLSHTLLLYCSCRSRFESSKISPQFARANRSSVASATVASRQPNYCELGSVSQHHLQQFTRLSAASVSLRQHFLVAPSSNIVQHTHTHCFSSSLVIPHTSFLFTSYHSVPAQNRQF